MGTPSEAQDYGYLPRTPQACVRPTKGARCRVQCDLHTGIGIPYLLAGSVARGIYAYRGMGVNNPDRRVAKNKVAGGCPRRPIKASALTLMRWPLSSFSASGGLQLGGSACSDEPPVDGVIVGATKEGTSRLYSKVSRPYGSSQKDSPPIPGIFDLCLALQSPKQNFRAFCPSTTAAHPPKWNFQPVA